ARRVRQVVGHGSLHRSGLDGDNSDSGGIKAAAESLEKERKSAFGRTVNVVGAASSISRDGGDGGQASAAPAFQIGGEQGEDRGGADKVDLQILKQRVDRGFGILLVVHGAVSEEHGVKVGKVAPGKFKDGSMLLNGSQVGRVGQHLLRAADRQVSLDFSEALRRSRYEE